MLSWRSGTIMYVNAMVVGLISTPGNELLFNNIFMSSENKKNDKYNKNIISILIKLYLIDFLALVLRFSLLSIYTFDLWAKITLHCPTQTSERNLKPVCVNLNIRFIGSANSAS